MAKRSGNHNRPRLDGSECELCGYLLFENEDEDAAVDYVAAQHHPSEGGTKSVDEFSEPV